MFSLRRLLGCTFRSLPDLAAGRFMGPPLLIGHNDTESAYVSTMYINKSSLFHTTASRMSSKSKKQDKKNNDSSYREVEAVLKSQNLHSKMLKLVGENGAALGTMSKREAQKRALVENLKLVMYDDKVSPPVYHLMTSKELHQFRMQQKDDIKSTNKPTEKIVRLTSQISEHDMSLKLGQITEWIDKTMNVRISIRGTGRNRSSDQIASDVSSVYNRISESLKGKAIIRRSTGHSRSESDVHLTIVPNSL